MERVEEVKRKSKGGESRFGKRYGFEIKLRCVKLRLEEGLPVPLLSREAGVSKSAIHHWVKAYQLAGNWVPFTVLPDIESDSVTAEIEMPEGTPAAVTEQVVRYVESRALALRKELDAERASGASVFEHVLASVGDPPDEHDDLKRGGVGAHFGRVRVQLVPGDRRTVTSLCRFGWRRCGEVTSGE